MSLSVISPTNIERENETLNEIFKSIDENKSIIFNSGAGAGKTYALIQSLKYVIRNYEKKLKKHNQKIVCITYTNVATKEVKERLGNTDLVLISTIHERIWELTKDYQKELVEIHKEKVYEEILKLEQKLIVDKEYKKYQELNDNNKEKFKKIMLEYRELFFQNYSTKAAEFKKVFHTILDEFPEMLTNVNYFRKTVNTLYTLEKLSECYEKIKLNNKQYKKVEYTSNYNHDRLHKMQISHDTLLEYGLKLVEKYDLLKQIIIDQYPFVFIDEYQDSDEKIVLIMSYLENYSTKIGHKWFMGYFGDSAQNIYDGGIGGKITDIHIGLNSINKEFNRRSTKEIIDVINKLRSDDIEQISIFDDCNGGSVKFYIGTKEDVQNFIDRYINEWEITEKTQLHCLVLTNKLVADYSGFKNLYETFTETDRYGGMNYNQLNNELLSNDSSKLGEIPKLLFNITRLLVNLFDNKTPVIDISPNESLFEDMSIEDLRELIIQLKQIKGKTLDECIKSIETYYSKVNNEKYRIIMDWIFGFENITSDLFENYLIEKLFNNISDNNLERAKATVNRLLKIDMYEYQLWYKFITDSQEEKVIYHTYHGTKGREFDNVIIIMENAFGRNKDYFNFYFENFMDSNALGDEDKQKYGKIQNLLYVSCSRAIKNLRVLYLDDITDLERGIKEIFGQVNLTNNKLQ
ncbi:UvrD-helicase domain-containing protein [Priestia flexa]|uniref:UvrD-helicase domain-containing protein n=1 Tax=Priestia flexa TaxID=86664 RepID=UPI001CD6A5CA|nr:UvrD-helicase domain-containing protein [Priestia flexa]MCA1202887.1 AAA family ATPase [Priestia flexa]